jgi:hypothetical protein
MKCTLLLFFFISSSVFAIETDQFHAASVVLKDSSAPINDYINSKFEIAIEKANQKNQNYACQNLADDVLSEIVGKHTISALSNYANKNPEVELFPDRSIKMHEYLKKISIYSKAGLPFGLIPIARTINIGGIYIGTDKLGHSTLIGRNYYRRYLKNLKHGMTKAEAEKETVMKGIGEEIHFLGYTLGGVLSYGDLEANFQGLQLALSMCNGENPYLIKKDGLWTKNPKRKFDIKNIITPKMDESYIRPFWSPRIWKQIAPKLKDVYCDLKTNSLYVDRIKFYNSKLVHNRNDDYLKEFFSNKPKFDKNLENLDSLCKADN